MEPPPPPVRKFAFTNKNHELQDSTDLKLSVSSRYMFEYLERYCLRTGASLVKKKLNAIDYLF